MCAQQRGGLGGIRPIIKSFGKPPRFPHPGGFFAFCPGGRPRERNENHEATQPQARPVKAGLTRHRRRREASRPEGTLLLQRRRRVARVLRRPHPASALMRKLFDNSCDKKARRLAVARRSESSLSVLPELQASVYEADCAWFDSKQRGRTPCPADEALHAPLRWFESSQVTTVTCSLAVRHGS